MGAKLALRFGGAVLVALLSFPAPAPAQPAGAGALPTPVIMVVDPQAVLQRSKAGLVVRAEHDRYLQSMQSELDANRKALKETENGLMKEKAVLSQEAWQQKARDFEQRVVELNQRYQKGNLAVEKSYRIAITALTRAFDQVTEEVAGEVGCNLILPIQQVILHDPRMDLTGTIIDRMDKKFPSVDFPTPQLDTDTVRLPGGQPSKK